MFRIITSDGKADRMISARQSLAKRLGVELPNISPWSEDYGCWRWPQEFICGALHFVYDYDTMHLTITERHLHILHRRDVLTRLDLLPLDMRRAVLEPMCRRIIMSRRVDYSDTYMYETPSYNREVIAALQGVYPCSLFEAIDRWTTGCVGSCNCPEQHRNIAKANALALRDLAPLRQPSARERKRMFRLNCNK